MRLSRRSLLASPAIVLATSLMGRANAQPWTTKPWAGKRVQNDVVVEFAKGHTINDAAAILNRHGAKLKKVFRSKAYHFSTTAADAAPLAEELLNSGTVRYAEPNGLTSSPAVPNDPDYTNASPDWQTAQFNLVRHNCPNAWSTFILNNMPVSGPGAMPPVIDLDTGLTPGHPDIVGNVLPGWSITNNSTVVTDSGHHGTEISGFIAANTNNGIGIASVGWGGSILPIQCDAPGALNVEYGLEWVQDNVSPPGVILIEFTAPTGAPTITLETTMPELYESGFFIVTPAGNSSATNPDAGFNDSDFALCVAAVTSRDIVFANVPQLAGYSSYGPPSGTLNGLPSGKGAVISAQGGDADAYNLWALLNLGGDTYENSFSGTSPASATIAAMARYLMAAGQYFNRPLTNDDIWFILTNPANGVLPTGFGGSVAPWNAPPMPLLDLCLGAVLDGPRSPYSSGRLVR